MLLTPSFAKVFSLIHLVIHAYRRSSSFVHLSKFQRCTLPKATGCSPCSLDKPNEGKVRGPCWLCKYECSALFLRNDDSLEVLSLLIQQSAKCVLVCQKDFCTFISKVKAWIMHHLQSSMEVYRVCMFVYPGPTSDPAHAIINNSTGALCLMKPVAKRPVTRFIANLLVLCV